MAAGLLPRWRPPRGHVLRENTFALGQKKTQLGSDRGGNVYGTQSSDSAVFGGTTGMRGGSHSVMIKGIKTMSNGIPQIPEVEEGADGAMS